MDLGHQKRKLLGYPRGSDERDRTPVPGKTCEVGVALLAPWLVCAEQLPVRTVERGTCPCGIVSRMELPWATECESSLAEVLNNERSTRRALRACLHRVHPRGGEDKQNHGSYAAQGKIA